VAPFACPTGREEETAVRTCSDVHNYLEEAGVAHEMLPLADPSTTAERAADLLGVSLREIVKSLLFSVDGAPLLVLVPGGTRVDERALAEGLGARHVALARAQDVLATTGYRVGAVPPCGLACDLPVVADPEAFAPPVVYCGGGATATMLKIRSADLKTLLKPRILDVTERTR
jgi:Cys-tRNA(Pro) deacylase